MVKSFYVSQSFDLWNKVNLINKIRLHIHYAQFFQKKINEQKLHAIF